MSIVWRFLSNNHGEITGINHSGVATFRGTPLKSLAREICQNSIDASSSNGTVKVDFHLFSIPVQNVPGSDSLLDAFERSKDFWKDQKSSQTKDFFDDAIREYKSGSISILRISDFNTRGLCGTYQGRDTDWANLTKGSGVSDKHGSAGGSFGIGKFATFACSKFSTVFYSTYNIDNEQAYQGISRIVTFEDSNGDQTTGLGYYGDEKNTPVHQQLQIDPQFHRAIEQFGSDIYIVAFSQANMNWKREIILSLLDSFLMSFWDKKLEVQVEDVLISKETLPSIIEEYGESLDSNTKCYYKVLSSPETVWIEDASFNGLGLIRLGLLMDDEDANRRIAMIRKTGMKIKDQGGFSSYVQFMGILHILGDKINEQLRPMENPTHTEWEPARIPNSGYGQALLTALNSFIRTKIEELSKQTASTEMEAVGLGSLIPDNDDQNSEKNDRETISDSTAQIETKRIIPSTPVEKKNLPKKERGTLVNGDTGGIFPHEGDTPVVPRPRPNPDNADIIPDGNTTLHKLPKQIVLDKFIPISTDRRKGKYIFNITPKQTTESDHGFIEVLIAGEVSRFEPTIMSASLLDGTPLLVSNNRIKGITFEEGKPIQLTIEINSNDYCAMEVTAYED